MGLYLTSAELMLLDHRRALREAQEALQDARVNNRDVVGHELLVKVGLQRVWGAQRHVEHERNVRPGIRNQQADAVISL